MKENPTIERVRKARHEISAKYGHDTRKLVQHYIEYQKQFAERLVTTPRKTRIA